MNSLAFLFDVRVDPISNPSAIGVVAGVAFFFVKKTVKMAIRMAIVGAILLIAIIGGISFWMFSSSSKPVTRPTNPRNR